MRTTSNHFSASALTHIGSNGVTLLQTAGGALPASTLLDRSGSAISDRFGSNINVRT